MYVWRNEAGRIESVTGSIHQPTLDWLLAEDEWRQSGGKKQTSARSSHPAKQPAKPEPPKQESKPAAATPGDPKETKGSDN